MTDFSTEAEKDAVKTKPGSPGCYRKQQASAHSPSTKWLRNSQEWRGYRLHWRDPALLHPWEDGSKAAMGRRTGHEEQLDFPSTPLPSVPLERGSGPSSGHHTPAEGACGYNACPGGTGSVLGCCMDKTVHSLCTISEPCWGLLHLSLSFRRHPHQLGLTPSCFKAASAQGRIPTGWS